MRYNEIIHDCHNADCHEPIVNGKCKKTCWDRYLDKPNFAKWKNRAAYNDFLWVECSNCGFRVKNYKAVRMSQSNRKYDEAIYKFCPMCGKPMEV
jgi:hypothetical protein